MKHQLNEWRADLFDDDGVLIGEVLSPSQASTGFGYGAKSLWMVGSRDGAPGSTYTVDAAILSEELPLLHGAFIDELVSRIEGNWSRSRMKFDAPDTICWQHSSGARVRAIRQKVPNDCIRIAPV